MSVLGIDIGGSSVKAAGGDLGGEFKTVISTRYTDPDRADILEAIGQCLTQLGDQQWSAAGLCLPGRMNTERTAIERSVNIPSLNGWDLNDLLGAVVDPGAPCRVVSDADAAGFDWVNEYPSHGRTAAISLGTGVGLCVLDGDQIVTIGAKGIGHLGHMDVGRLGLDDRVDRDGSLNTLESYIGAPALDSWMVDGALDFRSMGGDDEAIRALVRGLRVVHAIYQPDRIALLGGVGIAISSKLDLLRDLVNEGLTPLAVEGWSIASGDSGFHAARGAAKLAAQSAG